MLDNNISIAVLKDPHSHSDNEILSALMRAGMDAKVILWNDLTPLDNFHGFIIMGYDSKKYSRSGAIAAVTPMMQCILQQSELGKPILGIGSGAQILVEAGLVPGLEQNQLGLALTENQRLQSKGFYHDLVNIRLSKGYQWNAFTRHLSPKKIIKFPVSDPEGRFMISRVLLEEIERNGLHVFQYCDERGAIMDEFPVNPYASIHNIAAIANKRGNVMAMLPHPECTILGDAIFTSMREYIKEAYVPHAITLDYQPRFHPIQKYQKSVLATEWMLPVAKPDTYTQDMEHAFFQIGISVSLQRAIYWEIQCDSTSTLEKIKNTGVLFNNDQQKILPYRDLKTPQQISLLVRAKEDLQGLEKLALLKNKFGLEGIQQIGYGVVWWVGTSESDAISRILRSTLLYNPYSEDCYYYQKKE